MDKTQMTYLQQEQLLKAEKICPPEVIEKIERSRPNFAVIEALCQLAKTHDLTKIHSSFWYHCIPCEEISEVLSLPTAVQKRIIHHYPYRILWIKQYFAVMMIPVLLVMGIIGWMNQPGPLIFTLKSAEVILSSGQVFDPKEYVQQVSADATIQYPNSFTAVLPETRLVQYDVFRGNQHIRTALRITTVDDVPPILTLKTDYVELYPQDPFDCMDYVYEAYDGVAGDLSKKVSCRVQKDQRILYEVSDSYGNRTTAFLTLHRFTLEEMIAQLEKMQRET